jgi:4-amino-4-deoxy-L-arabinose transferase-like glycosyltransferase
MFNTEVGGQVAWLLPLAGVGLVAGLWLTRRAPRTDRARAAWVLFGVWALVHVAVFSSQQGIFHPYYVSALAPAVAALSGAGMVALWRWARVSWAGLAVLDATVAGSAWLAVDLLGRTATFAPALRVVIPVAAAVAIVASVGLRAAGPHARRLVAVAAVAGGLALLAGPAAYSYANLGRVLNGDNVVAGPATADHGMGGMGGRAGGRFGAGAPAGAPAGRVGGMGGTVSTTLLNYLVANQGSAKYLVAAAGSKATAPIIIATGKPVVTIGGFGGHDPAPTVTQLASMVASGQLKYVLVGGFGGPGGGGAGSALTTWVTQHGTVVSAAGTASGTLYRVSA